MIQKPWVYEWTSDWINTLPYYFVVQRYGTQLVWNGGQLCFYDVREVQLCNPVALWRIGILCLQWRLYTCRRLALLRRYDRCCLCWDRERVNPDQKSNWPPAEKINLRRVESKWVASSRNIVACCLLWWQTASSWMGSGLLSPEPSHTCHPEDPIVIIIIQLTGMLHGCSIEYWLLSVIAVCTLVHWEIGPAS